ncbi:hypothetical protein [Neptunomonas phycophila]|uniref:hypothetical protein n=1 Tax=Neptunomonas phycophila TaxID=1572645 RepID=UPI0009490A9B|nr:hypothetical protein [Neptunomonas phycophila]
MKILALQDESYYSELGVDFSGCIVDFGLSLCISAKRKLLKYDLVINCLDHDLSARNIICLANFLKIPTVYISDGIYDITNAKENPVVKKEGRQQLFPAIYGTIFCVGEKFKSWYGSKYPNVKTISYLPKRATVDLDEEKFDCAGSVLITTALRPYFNDDDFKSLIKILLYIIHVLDKIGMDYSFRIFDEKILREIPSINKKNCVEGTFSDALSNAKCVISSTSTVLQTCSLYGVSSVLLNHRDTAVLYEVDLSISSSGLKTYNDLKRVLNKEIHIKNPVSGISLSDYSFGYVSGLEELSSDFWNINFMFYLRKIYRALPASVRKKIKGFFYDR